MTPPAASAAPDIPAERHAQEPTTSPGPAPVATSAPAPQPEPPREHAEPNPTQAPAPERRESAPRPSPTPAAKPAGEVALANLGTGNWHELLASLGLTGIVQNIASHCELRANQDAHLQFVLDEANATLFNDSHSDKLRLALENYFSEPLNVVIETGQVATETPAMRQSRLADERQQQAVAAIEGDPNLQALMSRFDGELDRSTIVPTDP